MLLVKFHAIVGCLTTAAVQMKLQNAAVVEDALGSGGACTAAQVSKG